LKRVSWSGFDFSQPPRSRIDGSQHRQRPTISGGEAAVPRLAPAWWVHPNKRMLYVANPDKGTASSPSTSTPGGTHARPGVEYPIFSNKLPSFRVLHLRVCRSGGSLRERDWTTRRGLALSSGQARGSSSPSASWAHSCPRRRKRDGHAVDRPRRIPDTRRSAGWPSPPATGALYFADINSPNSVVKIDPDIGDEVGECASQLPVIYPSYQSALSNGRSVVDSECGQKAPSPSPGIIRAPSTGPSSTELSSSRCIPPSHGLRPPAIPTSPVPYGGHWRGRGAAPQSNRSRVRFGAELRTSLFLGGYFCHIYIMLAVRQRLSCRPMERIHVRQ